MVHFSAGDGSDCSETTPFPRSVPGDDAVTAAFQELVKGPDEAELEAGAGSFFSKATSDIVRSANLDGGLLVVDFTDFRTLIPNASSSCGSEALLSQLDRTAFQFEMVERVQYQIIGSCHIFASWVQRDCFESTRTGRISVDPLIHERASGSGCTLEGGTLPDGRWFGFISFAAETEIDFDLACWFSGAAASDAASEDGEESPVPNDYYIRNNSDLLRTVPVGPAAEVLWLPTPGDPSSVEAVTYDVWQEVQAQRSYRPGVWLTVDDDRIVLVEEQYVP